MCSSGAQSGTTPTPPTFRGPHQIRSDADTLRSTQSGTAPYRDARMETFREDTETSHRYIQSGTAGRRSADVYMITYVVCMYVYACMYIYIYIYTRTVNIHIYIYVYYDYHYVLILSIYISWKC